NVLSHGLTTTLTLTHHDNGNTGVGGDLTSTDTAVINLNRAPSDLNGDARSDIIWRNADGTTVAWEMNGDIKLLDANLNAIPFSWHIQDTGDFNGDGNTGDLIWRNDNGTTVLWEMNGVQKVLEINLNTSTTNW